MKEALSSDEKANAEVLCGKNKTLGKGDRSLVGDKDIFWQIVHTLSKILHFLSLSHEKYKFSSAWALKCQSFVCHRNHCCGRKIGGNEWKKFSHDYKPTTMNSGKFLDIIWSKPTKLTSTTKTTNKRWKKSRNKEGKRLHCINFKISGGEMDKLGRGEAPLSVELLC